MPATATRRIGGRGGAAGRAARRSQQAATTKTAMAKHPITRLLTVILSLPLLVLHLAYAAYLTGVLLSTFLGRTLRLPRNAAVYAYDSEATLQTLGDARRTGDDDSEYSIASESANPLPPLKVPTHMGLILVPPSERTRALALRNLLGLPSPIGASASSTSPLLSLSSRIAAHEGRVSTLVSDVRRTLRWAALVGVPELSVYDRDGWLKDCARHGWLSLSGEDAGRRAGEAMRAQAGKEQYHAGAHRRLAQPLTFKFAVQPPKGTASGSRGPPRRYDLSVTIRIVGEEHEDERRSEQTLRKREARRHIASLVDESGGTSQNGSIADTRLYIRLNVLSASDGRPAMARLASDVVSASLMQLNGADARLADEEVPQAMSKMTSAEVIDDDETEYAVPSSYTSLDHDEGRGALSTYGSRKDRVKKLRDEIVHSISVDGMERALRASPTIREPDVLLVHGSPPRQRHLHGFPPYALRLCEIVYDEGAPRGLLGLRASAAETEGGIKRRQGTHSTSDQDQEADPDVYCTPSLRLRSFVRALECFTGSEQRHGK